MVSQISQMNGGWDARPYEEDFISGTGENIAGWLDYQQQLDLALELFEEKYSEEKLTGNHFLREIFLPSGAIICKHHVDRFADLFANRKIYDGNSFDWSV